MREDERHRRSLLAPRLYSDARLSEPFLQAVQMLPRPSFDLRRELESFPDHGSQARRNGRGLDRVQQCLRAL